MHGDVEGLIRRPSDGRGKPPQPEGRASGECLAITEAWKVRGDSIVERGGFVRRPHSGERPREVSAGVSLPPDPDGRGVTDGEMRAEVRRERDPVSHASMLSVQGRRPDGRSSSSRLLWTTRIDLRLWRRSLPRAGSEVSLQRPLKARFPSRMQTSGRSERARCGTCRGPDSRSHGVARRRPARGIRKVPREALKGALSIPHQVTDRTWDQKGAAGSAQGSDIDPAGRKQPDAGPTGRGIRNAPPGPRGGAFDPATEHPRDATHAPATSSSVCARPAAESFGSAS